MNFVTFGAHEFCAGSVNDQARIFKIGHAVQKALLVRDQVRAITDISASVALVVACYAIREMVYSTGSVLVDLRRRIRPFGFTHPWIAFV